MKYDLTAVIAKFIDHKYEESERAELVREVNAYMASRTREPNWLAAQVAEHCVETPGCTPSVTIKIGLMYGIVVGVLAERERAERERRSI
jgi:hypothetical protein